jgi:hypothetical protein
MFFITVSFFLQIYSMDFKSFFNFFSFLFFLIFYFLLFRFYNNIYRVINNKTLEHKKIRILWKYFTFVGDIDYDKHLQNKLEVP